jgi:hypothetical protein
MCTRAGAISVKSEVGHSARAGAISVKSEVGHLARAGAISVKSEVGHSARLREAGARQGLREKLTYASHHRCLCVQLTKLWRSDRQCAHARL